MEDKNQTAEFEENAGTGEPLSNKYLTFFVNGQRYGIPIALVIEIIGMQQTAEVPEFPYYAKGIINLRGLIVPLIDVRLRLGYPEAEYTEKTCTIVINSEDIEVGLIVDEVDEVLDIRADEINPPTQSTASAAEHFVDGVAVQPDKLTLLMACDRLISEGTLDAVGF